MMINMGKSSNGSTTNRNGETYVWNAQISLFASIHNNFRAGFASIFLLLFASILIEYLYNVLVIMSHTFVHGAHNSHPTAKNTSKHKHTRTHAGESKFILPFSSSLPRACECECGCVRLPIDRIR